MLSRSLLTVLLLVLVGMARAPLASAETVASASPTLLAGPVLVGSHVVWGEARCGERGCDVMGGVPRILVLRSGGGRTRVLQGDLPDLETVGVELEGSATSTALLQFERFDQRAGGSVAGRLSAARGQAAFRGLARGMYSVGGFEFDLSDDVVAYRGCALPDECVRVTDLASRTTETYPQPRGTLLGDIQAAGPYLAYQRFPGVFSLGEIVVQDRRSGAIVYSATAPKGNLSLAEDGTLASLSGCGAATVSWYSIAEPIAHTTPVNACFSEIELVGNDILYLGSSRGGRRASVESLSLSGERRTVVAAKGVQLARSSFDADGGSLAYALRRCDATFELDVVPVTSTTTTPHRRACPVRLRARRLMLSRTGRRAVSLECPRGCSGKLTVRGSTGLLARRQFALKRGRTRLSLRFNRPRRTPRRSRHRRANVEILSYDRNRKAQKRVFRTLRVAR